MILTVRRVLLAGLSLFCLACAGAPRGTAGHGTEKGPAMTGDLSRIDHVILGIDDLQRGIEELERLTKGNVELR